MGTNPGQGYKKIYKANFSNPDFFREMF